VVLDPGHHLDLSRLIADGDAYGQQVNTFRWATVVVASPLSIMLDGDTEALPFAPDTLVDPTTLAAGRRVWVHLVGRRVVVLGVAGGTGQSGGGSPTSWTPVTAFLNGWSNYGGVYQVAQYRKVGDVVHLRGLIKNAPGVASPGTPAFVLPTGYRPPANLIHHGTVSQGTTRQTGAASAGTAHTHSVNTQSYASRLTVEASGNVIPYSTATGDYMSLDGVSFSVIA
jgi:hypothetical protein